MVTKRIYWLNRGYWELISRNTSLEKENQVGIYGLLSVKHKINIQYHFYRTWATVCYLLHLKFNPIVVKILLSSF